VFESTNEAKESFLPMILDERMSSFPPSTVIVTGGSRGYGAGIAQAFVNAGAKVFITGRDKVRLDEAAQHLGATPVVADVADPSAWDRVMTAALEVTGRLDVLVNNAGEGVRIGPLAELTDADLMRSLASNLTGAMLGCRRAAAVMQQQKSGLIVNIGSVCAKHAWPSWSVYSAAKAGLLHFSRCLLTELRPHGVRVTSVLPSWGQTEFTDAANLPSRGEEVLRQCISPAELGALIVQLSQQPAHLVTEELTLWPMVQPMNQL
jgi:NAD(P)-dependent dehydrogenase (short-subunit alcohol dehydrogenase family)